MRTSTLARVGVVAAATALLALQAGQADASVAPPPTTSYSILWGETDGTLAVQASPSVSAATIATLTPGTNTVSLICQTVHGSTDVGDGGYFSWQYSTTWDEIYLAGKVGFVYDHFINTPAQGAGGYSSGVHVCTGG
ncbi:hypothetical protein [Peterkaempfera sp. SMS 1(5)a]|uniref:hypothetical protein n=1 Tax=Peterkaempfera podocarpi TaxID=3232308 RepID=UPI00366BA245